MNNPSHWICFCLAVLCSSCAQKSEPALPRTLNFPSHIFVVPEVSDELSGDNPTYRDLVRQTLAYRAALDACAANLDYLQELLATPLPETE